VPRQLAVRDAVRRPIEDDAAAPEYGEIIADAADFPELMADEDDAVPIAAKAMARSARSGSAVGQTIAFCRLSQSRIGYNSGYTVSMKTAVSVPDDLFRLAEATARRLRVSRSQLYATAISEFLNRQQGNAVTERLNEVYSRRPAKVDAALHRAQLKPPDKDSW